MTTRMDKHFLNSLISQSKTLQRLPVGHSLNIPWLILLPDQSAAIRICFHMSINTVYCTKKKNLYPEPSLQNESTFCDLTNSFPGKWYQRRNEHRNSILMPCLSLPRSKSCFWLLKAYFYPITSTTQVRVGTRHQYGISTYFSQTSFPRENVGGVEKCWLFSEAIPSPETFDYQCSEKVHKFIAHCALLSWK